jgi:hypothetical protein
MRRVASRYRGRLGYPLQLHQSLSERAVASLGVDVGVVLLLASSIDRPASTAGLFTWRLAAASSAPWLKANPWLALDVAPALRARIREVAAAA